MSTLTIDYRPDTSDARLGIGLVGCGGVARAAHLPAYKKYGMNVVGAFDIVPASLTSAVDEFGVKPYPSMEALVGDPKVDIVDVAVRTEDRFPVIKHALEAGKHVLSQKPFANSVAEARDLVDLAEKLGLTIAVNQNGRWAPSWRAATLWHAAGEIGEVRGVSHTFSDSFAWCVGTHFDEMRHFVLYDFAAHWFDITRCWLGGKTVVAITARDSRSPAQDQKSHTPWNIFVEMLCEDGTTASIVGNGGKAEGARARYDFELVGSQGTIRGENNTQTESWVELDHNGERVRLAPSTEWFPDGFAGTMGELHSAVVQGREPFNSGRHVLASLELSLVAVASAEADGATQHVRIPL